VQCQPAEGAVQHGTSSSFTGKKVSFGFQSRAFHRTALAQRARCAGESLTRDIR